MKSINAAKTAFERNKILLPLAEDPCVIIEIRENQKKVYMPGLANILVAFRHDIESNDETPSFETHEQAFLEAVSICEEIKQNYKNMIEAAEKLKQRKTILLEQLNMNMIKIQEAEKAQDDVNHNFYSTQNRWIEGELTFIDKSLNEHKIG